MTQASSPASACKRFFENFYVLNALVPGSAATTLKLGLIALFLLLAALPAFANDIYVDEGCSLADAIKEANGDAKPEGVTCEDGDDSTGSQDTIIMPAGTDVINVTTAYPQVTSRILINGNNRTFDGGNAKYFFHTFHNDASLSLRNMTLTKGSGTNAGAIYHQAGSLFLAKVSITASTTTTGGGAAIFSGGAHLQISESYFANNSGVRQGGSDGAGAIDHASGELLISKSAFVDNAGAAAISVDVGGSLSASVKILDSTFTGNSAGMSMVAATGATLTSRLHHVTTLDSIKFGRGQHYVHNSIIWGGCTLVDSGTMTRYRKNFSQNNNCGGDMHLSGDPNLPSSPSGSGATTHFPLAADSPAVDSVGNCRAPVDFSSSDQLARPRPQPEGGDCDAGSFELVQVATPPNASFTAAVDGNDELTWTFDASGSSGQITSYAWNFGDGNTGTGQTPSHTYTSGGSYTVTLTATGPGGSGSATQDISVSQPDTAPTASFTVSVNRYQASFTSTSTGTNLSFSWDVDGDGTADYTTQNPVHTYGSAATYTVTLTVSNTAGSNSATQQITVSGAPTTSNRSGGGPSGSARDEGNAAAAIAPAPQPAKPRVSTCKSLPAHIVVSNITPTTQCQEVAGYVIGNEAIAAVAIYAVDVWGWVPPDTQVCFARTSGSFKFIDTTPLPRVVYDTPAVGIDGMICTMIDRPGMVALLPGPPAPAATPMPPNQWDLDSCMVQTKFILNLRSSPGGAVIGAVPYNATLTAMARTADWFKVDYLGTSGWVSNGYLEAKGNCG